MKPLAARDPFRIGLVAIAVGALLLAGIGLLSVVNFGTRTYTAVLAQTAGLRAGEDVDVHGVPVGKVTGVALDGDVVKVRFVVKKGIELGRTTSAEVRVATLLGTHYLAVKPGGTGRLDTIPLSRTRVPFNLQDVLERGSGALEQLDPDLLAQALTEMSKTLSASSENIGPALTGVARLSDVIRKRGDQTAQLLAAARSVSDQLSASSGDIVGLMQQANLVIGEITKRRQAIHTLLTETTTLTRNLTAVVQQTKADMRPAFRQLHAVQTTLRQQDATLKGVLDTLAPASRYVANALGNGPWADLWLKDPVLPPDDTKCRLGDC